MLVIVVFQLGLGMTVFVRLPGVGRLVVPVVMSLAGAVAVGMAVLMAVFVGMGMGMGMAVNRVAMAMRVGVDMAVLVGVLVLVLVPLSVAVVMVMAAVHVARSARAVPTQPVYRRSAAAVKGDADRPSAVQIYNI